jgi:hypothetical protein
MCEYDLHESVHAMMIAEAWVRATKGKDPQAVKHLVECVRRHCRMVANALANQRRAVLIMEPDTRTPAVMPNLATMKEMTIAELAKMEGK